MFTTIELRENASGKIVLITEKGSWDDIEFRWTEGNESCDCNRFLMFHRLTTGKWDPSYFDDPRCHCSEGRYSIRVNGEGEWR